MLELEEDALLELEESPLELDDSLLELDDSLLESDEAALLELEASLLELDCSLDCWLDCSLDCSLDCWDCWDCSLLDAEHSGKFCGFSPLPLKHPAPWPAAPSRPTPGAQEAISMDKITVTAMSRNMARPP